MLVQVELYLPSCHTLKEKRSVMKPLMNRIRNDFNVSAAETDHHDVWQSAALAFVAVSNERPVLERIERDLEDMLESHGDFSVVGWQREWL
jgi:uncharacterized protein YlxP (DUF503 family)